MAKKWKSEDEKEPTRLQDLAAAQLVKTGYELFVDMFPLGVVPVANAIELLP